MIKTINLLLSKVGTFVTRENFHEEQAYETPTYLIKSSSENTFINKRIVYDDIHRLLKHMELFKYAIFIKNDQQFIQ